MHLCRLSCSYRQLQLGPLHRLPLSVHSSRHTFALSRSYLRVLFTQKPCAGRRRALLASRIGQLHRRGRPYRRNENRRNRLLHGENAGHARYR